MERKKKEVRTLQSRNGQPRIMRPIFTPLHGSVSKTNESIVKRKESQSSLSSLKTKIKDLPDIKEKQEPNISLPLLISIDTEHIDELFRKKLKLCFPAGENTLQENTMREILTAMNDKSVQVTYTTHFNDIILEA